MSSSRQHEFSYGGYEAMPTEQLAQLARNIKRGMMANIGKQVTDKSHATRSDGKGTTGADSFQLQRMLLGGIEHEVRRRGMDPAHPSFGRDLSEASERHNG